MSHPTTETAFHNAFKPLCGRWEGTAQVWLAPDSPPAEGAFHAQSHLAPGQHAYVFEYHSTIGEDRADGIMLIGYDDKTGEHKATWVDSFHTGNAPMISSGKPSQDTVVDVHTTFAAGDEDWGWRTTFQLAGTDTLECRMYVAPPNRAEKAAVLIRLHRA